MRTTLDLDDDLLETARRKAAEAGETLTRFVERALAAAVAQRVDTHTPFRLEWRTHSGRALPGVDPSDRDALYERMDGR